MFNLLFRPASLLPVVEDLLVEDHDHGGAGQDWVDVDTGGEED